MFATHINEKARQQWLKERLSNIPSGLTILDAGAGELKNKQHCGHLKYVSQDFCQYEGGSNSTIDGGLQNSVWDTTKVDIVGDITDIDV